MQLTMARTAGIAGQILEQVRSRFLSLQIRYKFLISFSFIFFLSMLLCSAFIYVYVRNNIESRIESELSNTTRMIYNMVRTSVSVSTKNHLRAVAEKNLDIVQSIYQKAQEGELSMEEAKERAAQVLLSQTIGTSGYIYSLDSSGSVIVHPNREMIGVNVADYAFVSSMIAYRRGYLEYEWKNPGEKVPRPKALYMSYFEPWDWIISASTYREEFNKLLNVDDFRQSILSLKFGDTGYAFVVDKQANAIIHPKLQGVNIFDTKELPNQDLEDMMKRKKGRAVYSWKNPGETKARPKLVIFNYIPEYQWIVASSSYLDEVYAPLTTIRNVIFGIAIFFFIIMLAITFKISRTITTPLRELMVSFKTVSDGDYSTRMHNRSTDEVGQLAQYFNMFMGRLETTHKNLEDQIRVRHRAEQARRESQERYYLLMEAAPDPIVNYDGKGRVIYINPAFTRVFGWTLEEVEGRTMDEFVPQAQRAEREFLIEQIVAGISRDGIVDVETRGYSKQGKRIDVSISGAAFQGGSIVILRDISRSKRLEKQLMLAGDRERQKIGQDLHDDLCPHLIGIGGLAAVLRDDLENRQDGSAGLAEKIGTLIDDAVDKTRLLARGLCPVHLVSRGLQSALEEIMASFEFHPRIRFEFYADAGIDFQDNSRATHLYHIAREAVNNAVKHSRGTLIRLSLEKGGKKMEPGQVHLCISDNGQGIGPNETRTGGIGMQIMEYRAKIIDAQFYVETKSGGTSIHVYLDPALSGAKEEVLS